MITHAQSCCSHADLPVAYVTAWVKGARDVHNLTIDYVGGA